MATSLDLLLNAAQAASRLASRIGFAATWTWPKRDAGEELSPLRTDPWRQPGEWPVTGRSFQSVDVSLTAAFLSKISASPGPLSAHGGTLSAFTKDQGLWLV